MARYNRVVQNIERCFRIHQETDQVKELTFHAIRDWLNSNTKDGVTTAGLANPAPSSTSISSYAYRTQGRLQRHHLLLGHDG